MLKILGSLEPSCSDKRMCKLVYTSWYSIYYMIHHDLFLILIGPCKTRGQFDLVQLRLSTCWRSASHLCNKKQSFVQVIFMVFAIRKGHVVDCPLNEVTTRPKSIQKHPQCETLTLSAHFFVLTNTVVAFWFMDYLVSHTLRFVGLEDCS